MAQRARRWERDTMLTIVSSCQILDFPGYVGGKGRHGRTSRPAQTAEPAATRGYKYLELQEQLSLLNFMFILSSIPANSGIPSRYLRRASAPSAVCSLGAECIIKNPIKAFKRVQIQKRNAQINELMRQRASSVPFRCSQGWRSSGDAPERLWRGLI